MAEVEEEINDFRAKFETTKEAFTAFARDFSGQEAALPEASSREEDEASEVKAEVEEPPTEETVEPEIEEEEPEMAEGEAEATKPEAETTEAGEEESGSEEGVPEDMVQCLVCGEYYQAITEPHLQTHDMTIQEYRQEYDEDETLRPDDKA
jgi:hypothetical protein